MWQKLDPAATIIITPNNRMAAYLSLQYEGYQIQSGNKTWGTLIILPLESWLKNIWQNYPEPRQILLSRSQVKALWREIVDEPHLAKLAEESWNLMQKWQIPFTSSEFNYNEHANQFQKWAEEFSKRCVRDNLITMSQLGATIAKETANKKLILPYKKIIFTGFDLPTTQLKNLIQTLKNSGYEIDEADLKIKNAEAQNQIAFENQKDEILTMALWAKEKLNANPKATIGCVALDLTNLRNTIERTFREVFPEENHFNISLGKNLTSFPIIRSTLKILKLARENKINLDDIIELLHSPFIALADSEKIKRAKFVATILSYKKTELTLHDLIEKLPFSLALKKILTEFQHKTLEINKRTMSFSEWAKIFLELLQVIGWPGEKSLSSAEYQLAQRWLKLLNEFAALDLVLKPTTYESAHAILADFASEISFQPEHQETPINILGVYEAAGLNFDHLWIMGMDNIKWPGAPKIDPFIPIKLQLKYGLPHASTQDELIFAQAITERFKKSAAEIIYSYTKKIDDSEFSISPILAEIPIISLEELAINTKAFRSYIDKIYLTKKTESLLDDNAPPVTKSEKIFGGSQILKLQAKCPFLAFAECRLQARELEEPALGLNKADRGTLIHAALETIWKKIGTYTTLCLLNNEKLIELIADSVTNSINILYPKQDTLAKKIFQIEKICITSLLLNWLEIEKSRTPFSVIEVEKKYQIKLSELNIKLRIDRIDKLANGDIVIIDYKTGKSGPIVEDWFGERPDDPQLPLYCISAIEPVSGLAIAKINLTAAGFSGITKNPDLIPKISPPEQGWEELFNGWHTTIEKLAQDFCTGKAQVDPKDPVKSCAFCGLKAFCRIKN